MINLFILTLFAIFIYIAPAYAYLDPSSGSALVSTIIAAAGAILYTFKSFFYNLIGESDNDSEVYEDTIAIFGESKNYYGTFKLIVDELIKRKVHFRYFTLDLHDQLLDIESPYMYGQLINNSPQGFATLARISAPVMLATTPNIGTQGFPFKKPKDIDDLVHVFHTVSDISIYRKGSLDNYNSVIMTGDFQAKSIRDIEALRNLPKKELVTLGLPYMDELNMHITGEHLKKKNANKTILVGSSWGNKGCLKIYGVGFIKDLSKAGYNIIIRPHPQSFISEAKFMDKCFKELKNLKNITWDKEVSPFTAMSKSDILISDTSSIRFDYAFSFQKTVITLDIPRSNMKEFEADNMGEIWTDWASERIGKVVNQKTVGNLANIVRETLETHTGKGIVSVRDEMVVNWGSSSTKIVDYLLSKCSSKGEM